MTQKKIRYRTSLTVACLGIATGATLAQVPADPYSYSREVGYSTDPVTGLLASKTLEPDSTHVASCLLTTYGRDAYGNVGSATQANCAGTIPLRQQIASRTTYFDFAPTTTAVVTVKGVQVQLPKGAFPQVLTNASSKKTSQEFDPRFGALTKTTDPNGQVAITQVDDFGRRVLEKYVDGTSLATKYCILSGKGLDRASNSSGCPTPAVGEIPGDSVRFVESVPQDVNGATSGPYARVYFDRLGRVLRKAVQSFDGSSQPAGVGSVVVEDTDYNAYGAKLLATAPYFLASGSSTTTGANDYGMTQLKYDALGRVVETDQVDAHGMGGVLAFGTRGSRKAAKVTVAYDATAITQTNDLGQERTQELDVLGQAVRITDPLGAQIARQFDAFGNLTLTKDALQNLVSAQFDFRGRRTQLNDPDTGVRTQEFDPLDHVVATQSPKQKLAAQWTTMSYDVLGRMTQRVDPEYVTTWTFDKYANNSACANGIGSVCEITTSNGVSRKFSYDSAGRQINSRTDVANGPSAAAMIAYSATTGRVNSKTYPTGLSVSNSYTPLGFLEKLTLVQAVTISPLPSTPGGTRGTPVNLAANSLLWQAKIINAAGTVEQSSTGNGVNVTNAYEGAALGRMLSTKGGLGASTNVVNYAYSWDSQSNLMSRADANGDGSGAVTESYVYDQINRLTEYAVASPDIPNLERDVRLEYNALGSVLYKSDVGVYKYNASGNDGSGVSYPRPHALVSIAGTLSNSYQYDVNGNLDQATAGKFRQLAYTSFDLPDSTNGITGPSGTPKYVWSYDENHGRLKEIRTIASGIYAGSRTTWYYHPDQIGGLSFESEVNSPTVPSAENPAVTSNRHYLTAAGLHVGVVVSTGSLPPLGATDMAPPPLSSVSLVKAEYWHVDHLGSLVATTDHAGGVTGRYSYDPFGKRRFVDGRYDPNGSVVGDWSAAVNGGTDRGYTSHEHLDDLGIIHMNGRLYDPATARIMQADPAVQSPDNLQSYNRYTYCFNNPSICTDPSGFFSDTNTYSGAEENGADQRREERDAEAARLNAMKRCVSAGGANSSCGQQALPGGSEKRGGGGFAHGSGLVKGVGSLLLPNTVKLGEQGEPGTWSDFGSGWIKTAWSANLSMLGLTPFRPIAEAMPRFEVQNNELSGASTFEVGSMVGGLFTGSAVRSLPRLGAPTRTLVVPAEKAEFIEAYRQAANDGTLIRTDPSTVRGPGFRRSLQKEQGPPPGPSYDADHIVELCVGGANCAKTNGQWLQSGRNRAAGAKIGAQTSDHPIGTRYTRVVVEGDQDVH